MCLSLSSLGRTSAFQKVFPSLRAPLVASSRRSLSAREVKAHFSELLTSETSQRGKHFLKDKLQEAVVWYEEFTGIDEVRLAQKRVIEAQDRFASAQEKRRETMASLNACQAKLKEIYADMETTTRGEERYLQLITKEHALLKEERKTKSDLDVVEREERDSFLALTASVKDSQSTEKAQSEKTKYWSIIGSIVGTIIGIFGTSINNQFKMAELRKLIQEKNQPSEKVTQILSEYQLYLSKYLQELKELRGPEVKGMSPTLMAKLEGLLLDIQKSITLTGPNAKFSHSVEVFDNRLKSLEAVIVHQNEDRRLMVATVITLSVVVPFLFTCIQKVFF